MLLLCSAYPNAFLFVRVLSQNALMGLRAVFPGPDRCPVQFRENLVSAWRSLVRQVVACLMGWICWQMIAVLFTGDTRVVDHHEEPRSTQPV